MGAGYPVLAAAHMQQPVPVGEQDHRGVAVTMASEPPRRGDQPVDFRRGQVLPAAPLGVGTLGRGVHGADFPENDVWRGHRRGSAGRAAACTQAAYFPKKVPYRESPYSTRTQVLKNLAGLG